MKLKLLATTAFFAIVSSQALAQQPEPSSSEPALQNVPPEPPAEAGGGEAQSAPPPPGELPRANPFEYLTALGAAQYPTQDLLGAALSAGEADAGMVGEVGDLVVHSDGTVIAVLIRTGQAIGGESRLVSVPFAAIEWQQAGDGSVQGILAMTAEDIAAAPPFTPPGEEDRRPGEAEPAAPDVPSASTVPAPGAEPSATPGAATDGQTPLPTSSTVPAAGTAPSASRGSQSLSGPGGGEASALTTLPADHFLASDLVDRAVFDEPSTDADRIGNVKNLVVSADGTLAAFIIGVGGFLGIGEKDVGVPFDAIQLLDHQDEGAHAALAVTRAELDQAPSFTASTASGTPAPSLPPAPAGNDGTPSAPSSTQASTAANGANASPVDPAELTAQTLMGATVYGPDNNQTLGNVGDIALRPDGGVDAIIIDVGGFLGIGAKPVAVAMENLNFLRNDAGSLFVNTAFTREQLENTPAYDVEAGPDERGGRLRSLPAGDAGTSAGQPAPAGP